MSEQTSNVVMPPDMLGEIILRSREVEGVLHRASPAEVAGIHALTEMLGSRLPETLKHQLHYIATIRNRAAHENDFVLSLEEFERFRKTSAEALKTLQALFPAAPAADEPAPADAPQVDVAVEKELFSDILRKLAMLGYFPVAGVIYLLFLLLSTVFAQGLVLIVTVFYLCAGVLCYRGWSSVMDRGLLYVGGAGLLIAWIVVSVLNHKAPVQAFPRFLGWLPGVNLLYLPMRFLIYLKWKKFLFALAGCGIFAGAVYAAICGMYNYALIGGAIVWACSIAGAVIWGKKHER